MKNFEGGGQAFPTQSTIADANDPFFKLGMSGLSVLEYYAGQALIAFMSNDRWVVSMDKAAKRDGLEFKKKLSYECFTMAKEMIEARNMFFGEES